MFRRSVKAEIKPIIGIFVEPLIGGRKNDNTPWNFYTLKCSSP
jgi:hypothetical protein